MKLQKRIMSLLLALLMIWQLTPMTMAASGGDGGENAAVIRSINVATRSPGSAVVSLHSTGDARLMLALYTSQMQFLAVQEAQVAAGEQNVTINFSRDFPSGFRLRAMLVDQESFAPLCEALTLDDSDMMPTVDKFDPDRVLNFDGQKEENFAVLAEGVLVLHAGQDFSRCETEDEVNLLCTLYHLPPAPLPHHSHG